jgi:hypothetical protein
MSGLIIKRGTYDGGKNRKQGDAGLSVSSLEFSIGLNCFCLIYFKGDFMLGVGRKTTKL